MGNKRVTVEQILAEIGIDVERMAQKVADAINNAHAEFRQKTYQKGHQPAGKRPAGFSPSAEPSSVEMGK